MVFTLTQTIFNFTALTIPHEVLPLWFEVNSNSLIAIEEREYHCENKKGQLPLFKKIIVETLLVQGLAWYDLECLVQRKPLDLKKWTLMEDT